MIAQGILVAREVSPSLGAQLSFFTIVILIFAVLFVIGMTLCFISYRHGMDNGFKEGFGAGFEKGCSAGHREADSWWIGMESAYESNPARKANQSHHEPRGGHYSD